MGRGGAVSAGSGGAFGADSSYSPSSRSAGEDSAGGEVGSGVLDAGS